MALSKQAFGNIDPSRCAGGQERQRWLERTVEDVQPSMRAVYLPEVILGT
jgi:hypothetical protein